MSTDTTAPSQRARIEGERSLGVVAITHERAHADDLRYRILTQNGQIHRIERDARCEDGWRPCGPAHPERVPRAVRQAWARHTGRGFAEALVDQPDREWTQEVGHVE